MTDFKDDGEKLAEKIRITSGELKKNEYVGRDGQLKSFPQYTTNFINRVEMGDDFNPTATFKVEVYIQALVPEIKNEEETGRLIIKGLVPLYGGKVVPQEFVVANEKAVAYIEQNYETGSTVKLKGNIVNSVEVIKTTTESGFGEDFEEIKRNTVRELLVTGGTPVYEEGSTKAYTIEQIKSALIERETMIEEMKAKAKERANNFGRGSTTNMDTAGGFDVEDKPSKGGAKAGNIDIPF